MIKQTGILEKLLIKSVDEDLIKQRIDGIMKKIDIPKALREAELDFAREIPIRR